MKFDYKNFSSEYELKHIVWVGIEYDKEKLVSFFDRYQQLKLIPKTYDSQEELEIMENILKSHNAENLQKLQQNDFEYCRWATIEKLSRLAATLLFKNLAHAALPLQPAMVLATANASARVHC